MFWHELKYLRRICVKIYMDALCIVSGSWMGLYSISPYQLHLNELTEWIIFGIGSVFGDLNNTSW